MGDSIARHADTYQEVLLDNNFTRGLHKLFGNAGSGIANVERMDFVSPAGFTATVGFAIPVFDFGINPQHESFRIALVTGVDGSGNPAAYSKLASTVPFVAPNLYTHTTFSIHRYDTGNTTTANYTIFNGPNQGPGGLVFTLSDFVVTPGSTIYGYALFGYDVPAAAASAQLLDWTNAAIFPTNTSSGEGAAGGFDFFRRQRHLFLRRPRALGLRLRGSCPRRHHHPPPPPPPRLTEDAREDWGRADFC